MDLLNHEEKPQTRSGFFVWSVVLLLLTGACLASWILSFYVVAHPEEPRCYEILKRFKRLDPPKRFGETQVPLGDFLGTGKLLERFGKLGPEELARENARLLRNYLMSYRESKKRVVEVDGKMVGQNDVVYVVGKYDVMEARELAAGDLFPSGVVVLAQSLDSPQVLLEAVFPCKKEVAPVIRASIPAGTNFPLARSRELLVLLHAERLDDGRMQFTAVPLPYGWWQVKPGRAQFQLSSPEELEKISPKLGIDVKPGLPIVRGAALKKATAAYLDHKKKTLASARDDEPAAARGPELVQFDPDKDVTEGAPTPRVVRPVTPAPAPVRAPEAPPPSAPLPLRPMIVSDARPPVSPPAPAPVPVSPPSTSAPGAAVPSRVLTFKEAVQLAETQAAPPSPAVLSGEFVVTLVNGRRVELRTREAVREMNAGLRGSSARVVVEYPDGARMPALGAILARGFVIQNVARGNDGEVTILASVQAM